MRTVIVLLMVVGACAAPTTGGRSTPAPPALPSGSAPMGVVVAADLPDGGMRVERRLFGPGEAAAHLFDVEPGVAVGALLGRFQTVTDDRSDIGGGHFEAAPRLRIHTEDGSVVADVGPGGPAAPSPDGRALAWLAPTGVRTCDRESSDHHEGPEECSTPDADLVVAPSHDLERRRTVGRFEDPVGMGWVGTDELAVVRAGGRATITTLDGRRRSVELGGEPMAFASGRIAVTADGSSLRVVDPDGDTEVKRSFAPAHVNASFETGGRTLLVQTVSARGDGLASGGIVVLDLAAGGSRTLSERRANGDLLWTRDGAWFGYRREAETGFELVMCRADGRGCRPALAWTDGIQLLAFDEKPGGKEDR